MSQGNSAEIDARLAAFAEKMQTPRQELRRKFLRLVRLVNNGRTDIQFLGIRFDLFNEFESRISKLTDEQCRDALDILRA